MNEVIQLLYAGLQHSQEIRKSQKKLKKMTKVSKNQVKMGVKKKLGKSEKNFF